MHPDSEQPRSCVQDVKEPLLPHLHDTPPPPTSRPKRSTRSSCILPAIPGFLLFLWCLSQAKTRGAHETHDAHLPAPFMKQCHDLLVPPPSTYPSRLCNLVTALSHVSAGSDNAIWIGEPGTSAFYFTGGLASGDWWLSERPLLIAITPPTLDDDDDSTNEGAQLGEVDETRRERLDPGKKELYSSPGANITILTAEFERARAEMIHLPKEIREWVTYLPWLESESPYSILAQHVGSTRPVIVDGQVRSFIAKGLELAFEPVAEEDSSTGTKEVAPITNDKIEEIRRIEMEVQLIREKKDEREVGLLRCANQLTLQAIRQTRNKLRVGMKESDARRILREQFVSVGLEPEDGLVLFGENAALPHGAGTDRKLGKEDLVLIDVGGKWGGYVADITRTFALPGSRIPSERIEAWETVRQAQKAVSELISSTPDTPLTFADLDKAAREVISNWTTQTFPDWKQSSISASSPDYRAFTHRTGHGIGLDGHESPYLVQGPLGQREVQPGHVFSIEPGIYLPYARSRDGQVLNGFGARLEDCFVVTEKEGRLGGEWLSGPVERWGDI